VFGAESIWLNAAPEIVNVRVTLSVPNVAFKPSQVDTRGGGDPKPRTWREVFWPYTMERTSWPVYRRQDLGLDTRLIGPLIVESHETTVVAPPDATLEVDSLGNIVINVANIDKATQS
jgi:N-methylhydantoinase A